MPISPSPNKAVSIDGLDFDHDQRNDDALVIRLELNPTNAEKMNVNLYAVHDGIHDVFCGTLSDVGQGPRGRKDFRFSKFSDDSVQYQVLWLRDATENAPASESAWDKGFDVRPIETYFDDPAVKMLLKRNEGALEWRVLKTDISGKNGDFTGLTGQTATARFFVWPCYAPDGQIDQTRILLKESRLPTDNWSPSFAGDEFIVPVTPEQYQTLLPNALRNSHGSPLANVIVATIKITDVIGNEGGPASEPIFDKGLSTTPPPMPNRPFDQFSATLCDFIKINLLNPAQNELAFALGEFVTLEGEISEYHAGPGEGEGTVAITAADGTRYQWTKGVFTGMRSNAPSGADDLEGEPSDTPPQIGDKIRTEVVISRDSANATGFEIIGAGAPVLVAAGPGRLENYRQFRQGIAARIELCATLIESGSYPAARKTFGDLLVGEWDSLTRDELAQLKNLIVLFPQEERPVDLIRDDSDTWFKERLHEWVGAFNAAYGVNLGSLTRTEWVTLLYEVASYRKLPADQAGESVGYYANASLYLFHVLEPSEGENTAFLNHALNGAFEKRGRFIRNQNDLKAYAAHNSDGIFSGAWKEQSSWIARAQNDHAFPDERIRELKSGYGYEDVYFMQNVMGDLAIGGGDGAGALLVKALERLVLFESKLPVFGENESFNAQSHELIDAACNDLRFFVGNNASNPTAMRALKENHDSIAGIRAKLSADTTYASQAAILEIVLQVLDKA